MNGPTTRDRNWEQSGRLLVDAAAQAGVDPAVMVKIAGFESSFNPDARPVSRHAAANHVRQFDGTMAVSSAYGYGQFVDGTWLGMLHRYGEKYGVEHAQTLTRAQANAPELRGNHQLQAAMLAEFTRENVNAGARLGGPDPVANVYAFHNLGPADASKFLGALRTHADERVDRVLSPEVVRGNPALYGDGGRSVGDAYKAMGALLNAFEPYAHQARELAATRSESARAPLPVAPTNHPVGHPVPHHAGPAGSAQHRHAASADVEVSTLQRTLDRLGYKDAHGRPLKVDGDFGQHTREALQAFQRAHHLEALGTHGPRTQAALHAAEAALVTSRSNPHHALYERTLEKVREAEHARGIHSGPHSERIAAALTTELVRDGINRIDRVEFNTNGTLVRGVQVSAVRDEPGLNRTTDAISARQASTQSIVESSRQLQEVAANVQAQRQDPQFTQVRTTPAPSLSH